jgi:hypothetical protein
LHKLAPGNRKFIFWTGGSVVFIIDGSKKLDNVTLLLTIQEAEQLKCSISDLLNTNTHHAHVSSDDYQTEINISIFDKNRIESYHPDIRKIVCDGAV